MRMYGNLFEVFVALLIEVCCGLCLLKRRFKCGKYGSVFIGVTAQMDG